MSSALQVINRNKLKKSTILMINLHTTYLSPLVITHIDIQDFIYRDR